EDAHRARAAVVALVEEAPLARLAALDLDERLGDPEDVDAPRHSAGRDDRAVRADGSDLGHRLVLIEIAIVLGPEPPRESGLRRLDAVRRLARGDDQNAVEAKVIETLMHGQLDAVHDREHDHQRERSEDDADEGEEG